MIDRIVEAELERSPSKRAYLAARGLLNSRLRLDCSRSPSQIRTRSPTKSRSPVKQMSPIKRMMSNNPSPQKFQLPSPTKGGALRRQQQESPDKELSHKSPTELFSIRANLISNGSLTAMPKLNMNQVKGDHGLRITAQKKNAAAA